MYKKRETKFRLIPKNGQKFGKLTFIKETYSWVGQDNLRHRNAIFLCFCGNHKELELYKVKSGQAKSCGCLKKSNAVKHNLCYHPLYRIWDNIKDRCYNTNYKTYRWYGAKGIKMCKKWLNNFKCFYDWALANGWQKGLQVDKDIIPAKMGIKAKLYSPKYCSIVTKTVNLKAIKKQKTK